MLSVYYFVYESTHMSIGLAYMKKTGFKKGNHTDPNLAPDLLPLVTSTSAGNLLPFFWVMLNAGKTVGKLGHMFEQWTEHSLLYWVSKHARWFWKVFFTCNDWEDKVQNENSKKVVLVLLDNYTSSPMHMTFACSNQFLQS